jgi:acetyl-CoA acetyltransferase
MHRYGLRREQLGAIAINAHANAAVNPNAILHDLLTLDEYLDARMISTPYCLYDCDIPCDGATALVLSHVDELPAGAARAVHVEAVGGALHGRPSWDQWDDLTTMAMFDAAAQLWERTDFSPGDIDVAELYDGFSFTALLWLEALGICARGEAGPMVEDGTVIARDGMFPLNTDGGQLAAGRLHGFGRVYEACVQLRGDGDARQVPGQPQLAVATAGAGPIGAALLLRAS